MAVDKELILQEIQRCAAENGGVPLGMPRFEAETGIRSSHWLGKYWVAWNDAVREAGLRPNEMQGRTLDDDELLGHLAAITRKYGRFPTNPELNIERQVDPANPTAKTIRERLGGKAEQVRRLMAFAQAQPACADVYEILATTEVVKADRAVSETRSDETLDGVVYLIRSGRFHKIGRSNDLGRRSYEIALQLPEKAVLVHSIETDDPAGIERYWHERFRDRRKNGEWFQLSATDIAAFKRRRKFM